MKLPTWVQEYSLSLGIIFCLGALVLIENRVAMVLVLAVGAAFLGLSMVSAMLGPSYRR